MSPLPTAPSGPASRSSRRRAAWSAAFALLAGLGLGGHPAQAQTPPQPRVLQVLPEPDTLLEEQAVFALQLSKPLKAAPRALCDVWGIRSAVPVQVLSGAARAAAFKQLGVPEAERGAGSNWLALRCQTRMPDSTMVSLRWLQPERPAEEGGDAGVATFDGQRFDFKTRGAWPLAVHCSRSNPRSGCNPLDPVRLQASEPMKLADLQALRLRAADGRLIAPEAVPPDAVQDGEARELVFKGLAALQNYTLQWPATQPAGPGRREPLTVRMGPLPALAKFGAAFGIAEKAAGGLVPLSVRAVDGQPGTARARLRSLVVRDEAGIIEALRMLRRLQEADDSTTGISWGGDGEAEPEPERPVDGAAAPAPTPTRRKAEPRFPFAWPKPHGQPVDTRATSWLAGLKGHEGQDLPRPLGGSAFEVLGLPLKGGGLHLLEVESQALGRQLLDGPERMFVRAGALVTDLGVHMHWSDRTVAVWVTRLSNGQPVPGARVSLVDCLGRRLAQGSTQAQGWVNLPGTWVRDSWQCPVYAFARDPAPGSDDLGLASTEWQRGIETWRFESLANAWAATGHQIVQAVLARNLLRPGETLHGRIVWRRIDDSGQLAYPSPGSLPTSLALVHQGSGDRIDVPVSWDGRGQADLTLKLPEGTRRGDWRIDAGTVEIGGADFKLLDFRLPVLKAEVLGPTGVQAGTELPLTMRLQHLSGGPAAGALVRLNQRLVPQTPRFDAHPGFEFGDDTRRQRATEPAPGMSVDGQPLAADQPLKLGADGTRAVHTRLAQPLASPHVLVTEMEYRDPNGETYRAQGRQVIWPAALALGIKLDHWASGQQRHAELLAVDADGRPLAGVAVQVQGGIDGWVTHRRRTTGGFYSYATERRPFEARPLCEGRTGADGRFVCRFDAALGEVDSGEFTLLAEAQDGQGRRTRSRASLWLYAGGELWFAQSDHDRMDVLPEKRRWRPGETATLQVRSPFREALAWVNVMRGGTVVDTLVLPISGQQPTISLPIKPGYAPNVYVNVLAVRGRVAEPAPTALIDLARPAYKLGIAALEVGSEANALNVQVRTDRPSYQTRETAQVQIKVSAAAGALDAERTLTVFAVDEALLELLPNPSWQLLKAMTARRGYGFETASAAMQVIGKRHYGRKALPPGGGGGQGGTRELFDTLLIWRTDVKLDAQGEARLAIPINDSLTRFRVVAVAEAGRDLFGTGEASFTATRDLQLLSGLPATLRQGDQLQAVFTVRNAGAAPLQTTVAAWLDDQPLPARSLALAPQASQRLEWSVPVAATAQEQRWRIQAQGQPEGGSGTDIRRDALALRVPVASPLNPLRYTVGHQALAAGGAPQVWLVRPPEGSVAGAGELLVSLKPALAADAEGVRGYMRGYPFFCLEQRVSKAVSLKDAALWRVIEDGIDAYVSASGLLSYYPGSGSAEAGYDVLTSFVLSASHAAGWTLPEPARRRMLDALERFVTGKLVRRFAYYDDGELGLTERKLLALEALARHGRAKPAMADSLRLGAADWPRLSHRALVQWLDVLHRVDWPRRQTLAATALAELQKRLADDGRGGLRLKARRDEQRWYWMFSEVASQTRLALLAQELPALQAQADGLALGAVHQQQPGGHWWATQANVWGSLLLDKRASAAGTAIGGHTVVALSLPGAPAAQAHSITHDWAAKPQGGSYRLPARWIAPAATPSALALQHVGQGQPAVFARGEAWAPLAAPVSRGITLERSVRPVQQRVAGVWHAGDIAEVRLSFSAPPGTGWLVVSDPLPSGATVLGSGLQGQDVVAEAGRRGSRGADGRWEPEPAYVERSFTHLRAYYETVRTDRQTLTYQVRLNASGRFELPPTQVEAMYDPDLLAHRPNEAWEVR